MQDTSPEAEQFLTELARVTPIWRKLQQVVENTELCRAMALAGLRGRYPAASEVDLRRRLAALVLDRETVMRVYGWDPDAEGY
ncbi:MAG: hypothetical protein U1E76_26240 [Planctomycetota bacterium]